MRGTFRDCLQKPNEPNISDSKQDILNSQQDTRDSEMDILDSAAKTTSKCCDSGRM